MLDLLRLFSLPTAVNELQYCDLNVRINIGDDGFTSCKNLVNFGLVTSDMTGLICAPMYLYWVKIDLHTFVHRCGIQKCIEVLECQFTH